jgi:PAS domain S-box-containing protein
MNFRRRPEPLVRYGIAVCTPLLCVVIDQSLGLGILHDTPYLLLFLAVLTSAWYGGIGPGLVATASAALVSIYFKTHPDLVTEGDADYVSRTAIFMAGGLLVSFMGASRMTAVRQLTARTEELESTLASIGDAVIATDSHGVIRFINPVAVRLSGWSSQEAVGRNLGQTLRIIDEATRKALVNPADSIPRSGALIAPTNHTLLVTHDGSEIPIEMTAAPIRSERKEEHGVVLVFHDITERRRQERIRSELLQALEKERARIDDLVSSVPGIVWEAWGDPSEPDQRINFVSEYVETLLGYTREEWLATPNFWLTIVHPDDRETAARVATETFVSRGIGQNQFRWLTRDGRIIWVETHSMVITTESGEPAGMRGVTMDITKAKRVEQELRSAMQAAEAANQAKDNFLAMLSHELRTPLTPVFTAAHLLAEARGLSAEDHALVKMITQSVEQEARLIDDLLELTRINQGRLQLSIERVDIHDIIAIALGFCHGDLAAREQILSLELDAALSVVDGDAGRLQQVFWNLIKNASKFTPERGEITIRTLNPTPDTIRIEVSDNGVGIEPEHLVRIFKPFEQAEKTITRKFGGLGLGLAITSAIVELHDGTIRAFSSGEKHGSTFTIDLPVATPSNGMVPPDEVDGVEELEEDDLSYSKLRLLIVEGVKGEGSIAELIADQGYQIHAACSREEAIEILARISIDIVIIDLEGEIARSTELFRALRRLAPVRGIIIAEGPADAMARELGEAGGAEFLTRPLTLHRLQSAIWSVVG